MVLPGAKRTRSCYDRDVDPLYCAWGVDVYELFVNTKSDIGPNPYTPDAAARAEYLALPPREKREMGFEHRLFSKVQELVQICDRTVHRNQEKLKRELQRQSVKRGGNDYVVDVSAEKVEELVRAECQLEDAQLELKEALGDLETVRIREESVLDEQRKKQDAGKAKAAAAAVAAAEETKAKEEPKDDDDDDAAVKKEGGGGDDDEEAKKDAPAGDGTDEGDDGTAKKDAAVVKTEDPSPHDAAAEPEAAVKKETGTTDDAPEGGDAGIVIDREGAAGDAAEHPAAAEAKRPEGAAETDPAVLEELGKLTLRKQELLCRIATIVTRIGPLEESIHVMTLKLNFVRSDTTTDKTVCEISGNFMSARDADERIAAHYAGKQYVGWKLVRDKHREMVKQHGRHGPPRPIGRGPGGPPLQAYGGGGGGGGVGGYGGGDRGGGDRDRYRRGGGDDRDRYRGGGGGGGGRDRGGGGGDGRWERNGGGYGGGGGDNRRHDDRRGGGRRGGGGGGDRYRGSGGYGRR